MKGHAAIACGWLLAAAVVPGPAVATDATLPYRLTLDVGYGVPNGPESLRADLEYDLAAVLQRSGCFESVGVEEPEKPQGRDLLVRIRLGDYEESMEYLTTLGERVAPRASAEVADQVIARIGAQIDVRVLTAAGGHLVRQRRFRQRALHRPFLAEDAAFEARAQLLEDVLDQTRRFLCKGSAGKWARQIDRAMRGEGPSPR